MADPIIGEVASQPDETGVPGAAPQVSTEVQGIFDDSSASVEALASGDTGDRYASSPYALISCLLSPDYLELPMDLFQVWRA